MIRSKAILSVTWLEGRIACHRAKRELSRVRRTGDTSFDQILPCVSRVLAELSDLSTLLRVLVFSSYVRIRRNVAFQCDVEKLMN